MKKITELTELEILNLTEEEIALNFLNKAYGLTEEEKTFVLENYNK